MSNELARVRAALAGRYAVEAELGHGGMATVYLAEDLKHQRKVAVKVLRPDLASAVGPKRFLREIQIEAHLQHPNILPLHDSGEASGFLYYVMPYVEGESLRHRLEREPQLPVEEALRITGEVADALGHAHDHGVVHRDVKPENILLSEGHAVLADFGIARAVSQAAGEQVTEMGHALGTPAYMSPEQASGDETLDQRSDIYALGCVLYEMLAGEPPFTGRTAQAVIAKQIAEPPPSLEVVRPAVPHHVTEAIERALAKTRADRFATTMEFQVALERAAERPVRWLRLGRRQPWVVAAAAAALAAVTGLAVWQLLWPPGPQLDPNKVVVFPLVDTRVDEPEAGWDVAIAIGAAFEHTRPLKWIDGWRRLSEALRQDPRLVTPEVSRRICRERGARYYIDGVIRRVEDALMVTLGLYDVPGDSLVGQETSLGAPDRATLPLLGLEAITRLLPTLVGHPVDLSVLMDQDPGAILLWIQGEREYSRAHFSAALDLYQRAIHADSLLVFAAAKGAIAAAWNFETDDAQQLISHALAHDSLLPPQYVEYAHGLRAHFEGRADTAVSRFKAALDIVPEWSEALALLGEVYHHLLPSEAPLDSLAVACFEQAIAADSFFTPPLVHLVEYAIREGRLEKAEVFLERLRQIDADRWIITQLEIERDCLQEGGARFDWGEAARENSRETLTAAHTLGVGARQSECAKGGFKAVLGLPDARRVQEWGAMNGLQGLLIAEGRHEEALAVLDSALAAGESLARVLYVLDALVGLEVGSRAVEAADHYKAAFGDYYDDAGPQIRYLLGVWHVRRGELETAERIAESLNALPPGDVGRRHRLLAGALEAHLALARGDSVEALVRLRCMKPNAPLGGLEWNIVEPLPIERLLLARLLLARGEYQEAHDVASGFDHPMPIVYVPFVPASLIIRAEAAEALGRSEAATHYRKRLQLLSLSR